GRCSFESIMLKYDLSGDPALVALAKIVHAADISADIDTVPEGRGLKAIAHGFSHLLGRDDRKKIELENPMYDALYACCQEQVNASCPTENRPSWTRRRLPRLRCRPRSARLPRRRVTRGRRRSHSRDTRSRNWASTSSSSAPSASAGRSRSSATCSGTWS